jgi:hypothetical protein
MMTAARLPFEFVLPETGASEDLPEMFGPVPMAVNPIPQAIPSPRAIATPPSLPPKQTPVAQPFVPSAPATPLGQPFSPLGQTPRTNSPFPPAPPLPVAPRPAMPVFPASPQIDVRPAEVKAVAQTQLPYTMSSVTIPPLPTVAPVAMAVGGNVLKVSKEAPAWLTVLGKLLLSLVIFGVVGAALFGGFTYLQSNPEFMQNIPMGDLTSMFTATGWVIPGLLLGLGLVFIVVGYIIQKNNEA